LKKNPILSTAIEASRWSGYSNKKNSILREKKNFSEFSNHKNRHKERRKERATDKKLKA
jgi:hypothetical protein